MAPLKVAEKGGEGGETRGGGGKGGAAEGGVAKLGCGLGAGAGGCGLGLGGQTQLLYVVLININKYTYIHIYIAAEGYIFFVSLSRRISAHPFPAPIHFVRSLCWLIRGCRRNQDQMPSSPKVVMGGKFREKLFPLKILQNSARIVQLARVCPLSCRRFAYCSGSLNQR